MDASPDPQRVHDRADFGRELTLLREAAGLTVRDLATRIGVPPATVGGYLTARHLPSAGQRHVVESLLAACGVTASADQARWFAALGRARAAAVDSRPPDAAVPYRGLEPFEPEDAAIFFGRDRVVTRVLDEIVRLRDSAEFAAVLAVVGPSGSGKSSLLRAGVVPRLAAGAADDAGAGWSCAVLTPGEDPVAALQEVLTEPPRMLIVDQAEELFTLATPDTRARFLATIADLPPDQTLAVFGLRADFYGTALGEPVLADALQHRQVVVPPMTRQELVDAIVLPARSVGVAVDDGLRDVLLADLAQRGTAAFAHAPGALPLLSHALLSTWRHAHGRQLGVADYRAAGGIEGAVRQSAEEVFASLEADQQALARRIFQRLATVDDDGHLARRRVDRNELETVAGTGGVQPSVAGVLAPFVARRLLTTDVLTVEVSHEALLTAWPRLGDWLDEDRAGLRLHRQLTSSANAWIETGRDESALLRGTRLAAAVEWADDHPDALNATERDYVAAGKRQEQHERHTARRRTRRLQQLLAAVATLAVISVVLSVLAVRSSTQARHDRDVAQQARDEALSRQIALQVTQLRPAQPSLAQQLALTAYRVSPTVQARAAMLDSTALPTATRVLGPPGPMQALAVTPNGTTLAATASDGRVHLWRITDRGRPAQLTPLGPAQPDRTLFALAITPDGRLLATSGSDRTVELWNIADPARATRVGSPLSGPTNTVYALAFSPDGHTLAAGSADGAVHRWTLSSNPSTTPVPQRPLVGGTDYIQGIAFGPQGDTLAAGTSGGQVLVWRTADGVRTATLSPSPGTPIYVVAYSPDGATLAAGGHDGSVHRWATTAAVPAALPSLTGFTSWVNAIGFSPDGSRLAAGDSDATVRVWSGDGTAPPRVLTNAGPVTALTFLPDGSALATASNNGEARLWPLADPVLHGAAGTIFGVSVSRKGDRLIVGSGDHTASLWRMDGRNATLLTTLRSPTPSLRLDGAAAISPDGRLVAAGTSSGEGPLLLWDVSDAAHPRLLGPPLTGPVGTDEWVAFSPDGHLLASGGDDKTVRLWNVSDPAHPIAEPVITGFTNYVFSVAFSPDGRLLAAGSADKTAQLVDVSDPAHPKHLSTITGFTNYVYGVAFAPDGHSLAAASADKTARLVDITDPAHQRLLGSPLTGPTDYLLTAAISPDGKLLAAGGQDGSVWMWDITDREHPKIWAQLVASPGSNYALAFSSDGSLLFDGGTFEDAVHMWNLDPSAIANRICATAGDAITPGEWAQYVPGAAYAPPCH